MSLQFSEGFNSDTQVFGPQGRMWASGTEKIMLCDNKDSISVLATKELYAS